MIVDLSEKDIEFIKYVFNNYLTEEMFNLKCEPEETRLLLIARMNKLKKKFNELNNGKVQ